MTNSGIYAGDEKSPSSIVHRPSSKIYAIISDNRLGFFNRAAEKNIFITHQYNIKTPYRLLDFFINLFNHFFINRYDECWIPDVEGTPNLSGELAHNSSVNKNKMRYIGALTGKKHFDAPKIYDIIAVLSGPEPQRTHLEKIIISEFEKYIKNHPEKKLCLVRGVNSFQLSAISNQQPVDNKSEAIQNARDKANPTFKNKLEAIEHTRSVSSPTSSKNKLEAIQNTRSNPTVITNHQSPITNHQSLITNHQSPITNYPFDIFDFLTNDALNEKLMQSELLIARSGYSTIMDLAALKMPAILIPTPGQTEQEYLAQKLTQENIFAGTTQNSFDLEKALAAAKNFTGFKKNNFIYDSLIEVIGL